MESKNEEPSPPDHDEMRFLPLEEANREWDERLRKQAQTWAANHPRLASFRDAAIAGAAAALFFWVAFTTENERTWMALGVMGLGVIFGLRCMFFVAMAVWNPAPEKRDDAAANVIMTQVGFIVLGLPMLWSDSLNLDKLFNAGHWAAFGLGVAVGYSLKVRAKGK